MYKVIKNSQKNLCIIKSILENNSIFPYAVGLCKRDGSHANRCAMKLIGITDTDMFIVEYVSRGKRDTVNTNRLTIKMEA